MDKFSIASYIVSKYEGKVNPIKLQKLLYYCYVWQLVAGVKLFEACFEAWTHGPVEPDIYHKYKEFGSAHIYVARTNDFTPPPEIDFILDSYAVFSAVELSKTTQFETPWRNNVNNGGSIKDEDLIRYYKEQPFALNFPLAKKRSDAEIYYPPKTAGHYAFTFDMDKDYVPVFQSLQEYLEGVKEAKQQLGKIFFN